MFQQLAGLRTAQRFTCAALTRCPLPCTTVHADYCAAFTVDLPRFGRVRIQSLGFFMLFLLFLLCATLYTQLLDRAVWAFQVCRRLGLL